MLNRYEAKKHLENEKQYELIIPSWLFLDLIENKHRRNCNPISLRQLANEIDKLNAKQLVKNYLEDCVIHNILLIELYRLDLLEH